MGHSNYANTTYDNICCTLETCFRWCRDRNFL